MARGTWNVDKWNGSAWIADGTIYRPNQNLNLNDSCTQQKSKMADGSNAFFTPNTLYVQDPFTFQWLEIYPTDTFVAKVQAYVRTNAYLRLTTHLGEQITGNFLNFGRVWLVSVTDTYDLQASFEVI